MTDDIKAHAILLQQQLDAITGTDIAHIRHSEGGIDLAKRVVNLKNAADWLIHAICSPQPANSPTRTEGEAGHG